MHENFRIWPFVRKKEEIYIYFIFYYFLDFVWQKTHFC